MTNAEIVSRGVDWVTSTARGTHLEQSLWNVGEQLLEDVRERNGINIERTELRGYRGWLGEGIFLGKRDDSVMLRGSSDAAREVYRGLYAGQERYNITRLDLQVTGKFNYDNEACARETEASAIAALEASAQVGRRKVASIRGNGSGDTCSIGSRSSQRYLRCYDKTREQRGEVDEHLWRWEVEFKDVLAQGVADRLAVVGSRDGAIVGTVAQEFARKGVVVPWQSDKGVDVPTTGVGTTNDERRLKWLYMQVRPVISLLVNRVGLNAVLVALGLEDLISPESA